MSGKGNYPSKQPIETPKPSELTPDVIKTRFSVALTKGELGLQALSNRESKLVFNEDNLKEIAEYLALLKKAEKIVTEEFTAIKEPLLRQTQMLDKSKRDMIESIQSLGKNANAKYTKMCQEIEERTKKARQEKERIDNIKKGMDTNILELSQRIAACTTTAQLTAVQNVINLQKGQAQGKSKYMEFHPEMVERLNGLNGAINIQKSKIKELEKLQTKQGTVVDEEEKQELAEKIEEVQGQIDENKVSIQEEAIEQASSPTSYAEAIIPSVKPKRSVWKWEVVDVNLLHKKLPHLVDLTPNKEKLDELLKTKVAMNELNEDEETVINGIKFFKHKTY